MPGAGSFIGTEGVINCLSGRLFVSRLIFLLPPPILFSFIHLLPMFCFSASPDTCWNCSWWYIFLIRRLCLILHTWNNERWTRGRGSQDGCPLQGRTSFRIFSTIEKHSITITFPNSLVHFSTLMIRQRGTFMECLYRQKLLRVPQAMWTKNEAYDEATSPLGQTSVSANAEALAWPPGMDC